MVYTCFHISTSVIYSFKLTGLHTLVPPQHLSWHLYSTVFTYFIYKIFLVLCADNIKIDLSVPTLCYDGSEWQGLAFWYKGWMLALFLKMKADEATLLSILSQLQYSSIFVSLENNSPCFANLLVLELHWLPEKQLIFKTSFCWCRWPCSHIHHIF